MVASEVLRLAAHNLETAIPTIEDLDASDADDAQVLADRLRVLADQAETREVE